RHAPSGPEIEKHHLATEISQRDGSPAVSRQPERRGGISMFDPGARLQFLHAHVGGSCAEQKDESKEEQPPLCLSLGLRLRLSSHPTRSVSDLDLVCMLGPG